MTPRSSHPSTKKEANWNSSGNQISQYHTNHKQDNSHYEPDNHINYPASVKIDLDALQNKTWKILQANLNWIVTQEINLSISKWNPYEWSTMIWFKNWLVKSTNWWRTWWFSSNRWTTFLHKLASCPSQLQGTMNVNDTTTTETAEELPTTQQPISHQKQYTPHATTTAPQPQHSNQTYQLTPNSKNGPSNKHQLHNYTRKHH